LFDKVIQFLRLVSHRSSALEVDGKILSSLRDSLFPKGVSRDAPDHQPKHAPQFNGPVRLPSLSMSSAQNSNRSSIGKHIPWQLFFRS
ncbi:uncharacterized protein PpBr36_10906, partial [Pyricularia pennisetigena]